MRPEADIQELTQPLSGGAGIVMPAGCDVFNWNTVQYITFGDNLFLSLSSHVSKEIRNHSHK